MWAVLAVAAASAIAQWYNSEQARNANSAELARMKELYEKIQLPNFNPKDINPEEFKVLGKYIPEVAGQVAEVEPTLLQESSDMKLGREAQIEALRGLRRAATEESDPALAAQLDLASRRGQAESQSRQESLLQDAARRGQASSLNTLMTQMKGAAQANNLAAQQRQQAAIEAYRNKLAALRDSANLGGDIRGQDVNFQQTNMNAINAFNQRTAANRQNYLNSAANIRNDAQLKNMEAAQKAADANINAKMQAAIGNRNYLRDIQQTNFENQYKKAGGQSNISNAQMGQNIQNAADRNQAIQSIGDAYNTYQTGENKQDIEKKKAIYAKTGVWPEDN